MAKTKIFKIVLSSLTIAATIIYYTLNDIVLLWQYYPLKEDWPLLVFIGAPCTLLFLYVYALENTSK